MRYQAPRPDYHVLQHATTRMRAATARFAGGGLQQHNGCYMGLCVLRLAQGTFDYIT